MKVRAIAVNTFASLLRNKIIILFSAIFICVLLLFMAPIMAMKTMAAAKGAQQAQSAVLGMVGMIMSMVSGFGSLLAAWSSADAVAAEMQSGTILAVMARPVRRWEFLLGKFLGVQMLMAVYTLFMLAMSFLLAQIGGERIHSAVWPLILYPITRYAIYSALAVLLVTRMHPILAFGCALILSAVTSTVAPASGRVAFLSQSVRRALWAVLPSMDLLSESRFLAITEASLKQTPWTAHVVTLAYGVDYALVLLLAAFWSFRRRSLTSD